ncbi:MAG: LacI family DNA-binding transcriptional regulator [Phycisphaerales bacterium]|nr:LacI family DNA-binding transcriptional regulator [Phycisphaerales bacterium]
MPVRPRLLDVARLCGVTPATVSRVLNGKKSFSTSDAVRENILATAARLGYVPDLAARNLNRRQTHMIGLFASPATHVGEGINDSLLDGISAVLHNNGYDVFFEIAGNSRSQPALPSFRFDAAVLLQAPRADTITELNRRRVPYVCVNERAGNPVASVLADDPMGMRRAVEHLAHLGHRRIGYANAVTGYFAHHSIPERYETLAAVARELGLELAPGHEVPFSSAGEFLETAVRRGGATAVIAYDHRIAVSLLGAAYASGLRVPADFSLICFNDVFPTAVLYPALTVVAVCGREMGRIGAEMLLNSLANPDSVVSDRVIRVPEDLVVRGSTAPARIR